MTAAERIREAALCEKDIFGWFVFNSSDNDFSCICRFKENSQPILKSKEEITRTYFLFVAEAMESENA